MQRLKPKISKMGGASNRFFSLLSSTTTHPLPLTLPLHLHRCVPRLFLLCLSRHYSNRRPLYRYCSLSSSSSFPLKSSHHFNSHSHSPPQHPWPEWSHLLDALSAAGYNNNSNNNNNNNNEIDGREAFTVPMADDFVQAACLYMAFARARPGLLRLLCMRDVQVVVANGTPFLFHNGDDSARRMRFFLGQGIATAFDTDKAQTVDLMRYILSYASNPVFSSEQNISNKELVESSVRNLLREMAKLCYSASESNSFGRVQNPSPNNQGETPTSRGNSIEIKRGDWICSRCNFTNFAKNMKCLECSEARPNRQLTGREWECPQCEFFNYGKNMACLRCDCKRPGDVSCATTKTGVNMGYENGVDTTKADIDSRLAASEKKAQQWFSKISQLDTNSDMSSAISDEDFPEIMPSRKGVNRFVVSTRKTPLWRRLANAQYQRNLDNGENKDTLTESANKSLGATASQTLDNILGRPSVSQSNMGTRNVETADANAQFVPLPPDAFGKKSENSFMEKSVKQTDSRKEEKEQTQKSERWFKRVAELHDVTDLPSAIANEDFPDIMPLRKGTNRFVVSKKKDRSMTSPAYKRGTAMEQANNTNYVPFVPFPPDYFAKADNLQTKGIDLDSKMIGESTPAVLPENPLDESSEMRPGKLSTGNSQQMENQQSHITNWSSGSPGDNLTKSKITSVTDSTKRMYIQSSGIENIDETVNPCESNDKNIRQGWTGKSLEGSAVKEPDPLDMSEEAKAERWFKRVAQIQDISELSQIPDEDFPSIMPMRKGVNRFVVSKRKTPLERRLTSLQYRKNLPIVSSDPGKDDDRR